MKRTVILANGCFPRKGGEAWKLLASAKRVVACDGAADAYIRRFHRAPDFIVGDLDSIGLKYTTVPLPTNTIVQVSDQNTNDLAKAIDFCRGKGWKDLVIVGATGKREDHELGNIFRAMEAGVEVVTDYGRFLSVARRLRLRVGKGAAVSVFATDCRTRMRSTGLAWPLDAVKFTNLYGATLNRAASATITISSTCPFFLYIAQGD